VGRDKKKRRREERNGERPRDMARARVDRLTVWATLGGLSI